MDMNDPLFNREREERTEREWEEQKEYLNILYITEHKSVSMHTGSPFQHILIVLFY